MNTLKSLAVQKRREDDVLYLPEPSKTVRIFVDEVYLNNESILQAALPVRADQLSALDTEGRELLRQVGAACKEFVPSRCKHSRTIAIYSEFVWKYIYASFSLQHTGLKPIITIDPRRTALDSEVRSLLKSCNEGLGKAGATINQYMLIEICNQLVWLRSWLPEMGGWEHIQQLEIYFDNKYRYQQDSQKITSVQHQNRHAILVQFQDVISEIATKVLRDHHGIDVGWITVRWVDSKEHLGVQAAGVAGNFAEKLMRYKLGERGRVISLKARGFDQFFLNDINKQELSQFLALAPDNGLQVLEPHRQLQLSLYLGMGDGNYIKSKRLSWRKHRLRQNSA